MNFSVMCICDRGEGLTFPILPTSSSIPLRHDGSGILMEMNVRTIIFRIPSLR